MESRKEVIVSGMKQDQERTVGGVQHCEEGEGVVHSARHQARQ